jgi:LysM repeat protein
MTEGTGLKNQILISVFAVLLLTANQAQAQTLKGSRTSVRTQYELAQSYGFSFINTAKELTQIVESGELQKVSSGRYIELHSVSFPYAVAETSLFLERLSQQYVAACGEKLTVTSLLRPVNRQPVNAVALSVHPTGMAVDLRIPQKSKCRSWLEETLLALEKERVLDVTRERFPPHYHVAVYAEPYAARVAALEAKARQSTTLAQTQATEEIAVSSGPASNHASQQTGQQNYIARKGDSLWKIAANTGVSVAELRAANNLRSNRIVVGQTLHIPDAANGSALQRDNNIITHRVNRGDTLWTIANQYGTSVKKLQQVNNTGKFLQVGQLLTIYPGAG